ncbi:MAG: DUF6428 family protein [Trueperaceae bacterium]
MNTQEFITRLESLPNQALIFDYGDGTVKPGYHVTEVMNVTYESMDCGGQANFWRETIVQLMGPNIQDKNEYMTVEKFLRIYKKVSASVSVQGDSEMRFEYGDARHPAVHYHISDIRQEGESIKVFLIQPGVTCKASDRKLEQISSCPPAKQALNAVVWGDSASQTDGCCS